MAISYNGLWKILIDNGMKKGDLKRRTGISSGTIAKMTNGEALNPLGAHKDRHARLGEGHIGLPALKRFINHPALAHLPFYLETPNDLDGYAKEIQLMREAWNY